MVLTILALTTFLAVQATDYLVDQARYENTQQTLLNIQNAVTGPVSQANADSTVLASGFIADVGRPPLAVANASNDPSQHLMELTSIRSVCRPMRRTGRRCSRRR